LCKVTDYGDPFFVGDHPHSKFGFGPSPFSNYLNSVFSGVPLGASMKQTSAGLLKDKLSFGVLTPDAMPLDRMYIRGYKPGKVNVRKRGRRGSVWRQISQQLRNNRIPLPSMILSNVPSLRSEIDELQANVNHLGEFGEACIMAVTETWLTHMESDSSLDIDGFGTPIRLDCDCEVTGKTKGGGVCLYINRRWCRNLTYSLFRLGPPTFRGNYPQLFVTVVYIHPKYKANAEAASELIFKVTQELQSISPDSLNFIMGDFNHCK